MSRFPVTALLAWSVLALPASAVFGQEASGAPDRSNSGSVTSEGKPVATCQTSGGGSRTRASCEAEPLTTTVRTEQELKISIEIPAFKDAQCSATTTTEYRQLNTIARVNSTIHVADCTVASGTFTMALRVSEDSGGEDKPLEFSETWQRSDAQDVKFTADYPIGENVELRSVRVRALRCACADAPQPAVEAGDSAVTLEQPLAEK